MPVAGPLLPAQRSEPAASSRRKPGLAWWPLPLVVVVGGWGLFALLDELPWLSLVLFLEVEADLAL